MDESGEKTVSEKKKTCVFKKDFKKVSMGILYSLYLQLYLFIVF